MRVKVIFPPDDRAPLKEFTWEAPGVEDKVALEQTFREFNIVEEGDSHIERKCRSMSVGDLAICMDSGDSERIYICAGAGWKLVTTAEAVAWMGLKYRDRILGPS